jgi:hypothetical protein
LFSGSNISGLEMRFTLNFFTCVPPPPAARHVRIVDNATPLAAVGGGDI